MITLSATFLGKNDFDNIVTMPWKWASTDHQRFQALHLRKSRVYVTTLIHNRTVGPLSRQKCLQQDRYHVSKWASTECQRLWILHLVWSNGNGTHITHNEPIGGLDWQQCKWQYRVPLLQLSIHRASIVLVEAQNATQQWTALCCS